MAGSGGQREWYEDGQKIGLTYGPGGIEHYYDPETGRRSGTKEGVLDFDQEQSDQQSSNDNSPFLSGGSLQDTVRTLYERGMGMVRQDLGARGMLDSSMHAQAAAKASGEALLNAWQIQESQERLRLQEQQQQQRYDLQRNQIGAQQASSMRQARLQEEQMDKNYQTAMARLESQDAWRNMQHMVQSAPADQDVVDEWTSQAERMTADVQGEPTSGPQLSGDISVNTWDEDYEFNAYDD